MTTITFIDGKQVDGPDREGLLGSDDFLVFLSRASERAIPDCPENWAIERPLTSPAATMPAIHGWRRLIVARCRFVYSRQSGRGMDNIRVIYGGFFSLVAQFEVIESPKRM